MNKTLTAEEGPRYHFCGHCQQTVAYTTLRRHKQLYFDEQSSTWIKKVAATSVTLHRPPAESYNGDTVQTPQDVDDEMTGKYLYVHVDPS